ncbi:MAG TPA: Hpt domain-containing protein [Burkholderiales bacterium]|nr:Hpt domain-containing protein [Burkholderiales bacterium]
MSDMAEYDIAPLSWIKTEIDHALQQIYELLTHFKVNEDDPAALRPVRTYLHQVRGAVEMVDLPGVALVCQEIENLTEALEHATIQVTGDMLDLLADAGHAVEHYLDELLKDKPNLELLLFPVYQRLRAARGVTQTNESDLFFPDMNQRAPTTGNAPDLDPALCLQRIRQSRLQFQRGLLAFLRQQDADQGLNAMRSAVADMETAMTTSAGRTFWWGAGAFVDCLVHHSIEPNFAVKQLCGRIDLQMRRHIEGSHKIAERLLRDLLYFIAQSRDINEHVAEVKKTFDLTRLLPNPIDTSREIRDLRYSLKKILLTLNNAKEFWIKFASGNRASLSGFQAAISDLSDQTASLNNTQINKLINEIREVAKNYPDFPAQRHEAVNLEVATTLLLLQNNLEHYENISGELLQQVEVQTQRLRAAAYSENTLADIAEIPLLDEISRQAQEKLLMAQVAQEIQLNIQKIEEALDSFFRDPMHERQLIAGLNRPLTEIQGALNIMQLEAAAQILGQTHSMINRLADPAAAIDESTFPIIADAISSISLYVDAQRYNRPAALNLLQPVLIQLGLAQDFPAASPANERIEDELKTLNADLYRQLETWQNHPDKEAAKSTLVETLIKIGQDADLVGDTGLKDQTGEILARIKAGNDHALIELARNMGVPAPGSDTRDAQPVQPGEEIDAELLAVFLEEAREVLVTIANSLEMISGNVQDIDALRILRRSYHTLKGSGRMVGLDELGEAAWAIEQLLNLWLQDENTATPELMAVLNLAYPTFSLWIDALQNRLIPDIDYRSLIAQADQLRLAGSGNTPAATGIIEEPASPADIAPAEEPSGPEVEDVFQLDIAAVESDIPLNPPAEDTGLPDGNNTVTPTLDAAPDHRDISLHEPDSSDEFYASVFFDTEESSAITVPEDPVSAAHVESGNEEVAQTLPDNYDFEPTDERIAIGANLISPMLLDIFLREASQHYQTLRDEFDRRRHDPQETVSYEFMRAAHTLAGIAGLTGFATVADLAHALESWLNRLHSTGSPLPDNDLTTDAAITRIGQMLECIIQQQSPGPETDLIEQINRAQISIPAAKDDSLTNSGSDDSEAALPELQRERPAEHTAAAADADIVHTDPILDTLLLPSDSPDQQHKVTDDVDDQLLPIFLEEASDLLPEIEKSVRNWRQDPDGEEQTNIQRLLHTLKGSARMAGAMRLGELTHTLETEVVEAINRHSVADTDFDRFETELDQLTIAIEQLRNPAPPSPVSIADGGDDRPKPATAPLAEQPANAPAVAENESGMQTLRVRAETVDRLVNEAGEINITRSRLESSATNIRLGTVELNENLQRLRTQLRELEIQAESQMQSNLSHMRNEDVQFDPLEFDRFTRLQELTRMIAESVNDIGTVQQNLAIGLNETDAAITQQGRLAKDLQQALMHIRMVPLASISDRLHRTVRLAAKDLGKKASLQLVGAHVEFDRGILDKIVAPLEHLLRNSVAHGIEMPQERILANKSEYGEIVLYTRQEGNEIIIALRDDGRGLDLEAIRTKAIENGVIESGAEIPVDELMQLIFATGFSTAESVTTLSGRGIGMDVVKNEITQLGGRIDLASETGKGVQFSIYLPLTLAVTQTVMVTISDRKYAIPSAIVEQVQEYKTERLQELLAARQISWQNNHYDFFYLPHLLGETSRQPLTQNYSPVLLLRSGNQRVAILVDHLTGNQEVVVKNIGPQLSRVVGIAGATVMGNGQIVLILNPVQLAQRQGPVARSNLLAAPVSDATPDRPIIMVVDDSLTVRKIASRMLNREGYEVVTAKDGIDALQLLQNTIPVAMLLDIEMPRMDGFELTKVMRADHKMANIPIIMITSRTADKHRDHAFSLGVNAYLGKPYQDEVLLEKIRELSGADATA